MAHAGNPFGNGTASVRVAELLKKALASDERRREAV
jgi:UDP-N-acetylglucosamine 2-epimerase